MQAERKFNDKSTWRASTNKVEEKIVLVIVCSGRSRRERARHADNAHNAFIFYRYGRRPLFPTRKRSQKKKKEKLDDNQRNDRNLVHSPRNDFILLFRISSFFLLVFFAFFAPFRFCSLCIASAWSDMSTTTSTGEKWRCDVFNKIVIQFSFALYNISLNWVRCFLVLFRFFSHVWFILLLFHMKSEWCCWFIMPRWRHKHSAVVCSFFLSYSKRSENVQTK